MKGDGNRAWKSVRIQVHRTPDGDSWLEQEGLVEEMFSLMSNEIREATRRG